MDNEKETKPAKKTGKKSDASPIVAAAKAIGKVAGTVASTLGVHEVPAPSPGLKVSAPSPASTGKLPKKNKQRLPRRQKKALKRKLEAAGRA